MVAPPEMDIALDDARQTVSAFRSSCLVSSRRCAVTGKGRSWCVTPTVGPALQACHIVPQQHYHLYPEAEFDSQSDDAALESSPRRLRDAWDRTRSARNGILLLSHLREVFDARLFSIHPHTLLVRVFMPCDVLLDYHGRQAMILDTVDRGALPHHYDMCCIENISAMTRAIPFSDTDCASYDPRESPSWEGCISPWNGEEFLSIVNWELR